MAEIVRMPKLSDTMTEGVVAAWHKNVGDKVQAGDLLAEIETDKATMEFESFQEGVLLHVGVETGGTAPVDSILAVLGKDGEDISQLLAQEKEAPKNESSEATPKPASETSPTEATAPATKESSPTPTPQASESTPQPSQGFSDDHGRIKASPLARSMARDRGIDLRNVKGTGDLGRIVRRDIEDFKGAPLPSLSKVSGAPVGVESSRDEKVSQMRKTIARRLAESKFTAPHFYLTMDMDMDEVVRARKAINERLETKVSFNDIVIKAVALALKKHPEVNASWLGDTIRYHEHVHMGVAVAVPDGLVVPVIRHADQKSLVHIASEVRDFAGRAREKKIQPDEMQGNTFSISNLGMYGIEAFTAIINPPDACILAVGAIRQEPVVKEGQIVVGNRMKVTLSCDHRVVDGAKGSEFLRSLKGMLEQPLMMLA
jgi:pyruvate dehydrogenase E2 component (dihydrolipoamide acetyltransferase)